MDAMQCSGFLRGSEETLISGSGVSNCGNNIKKADVHSVELQECSDIQMTEGEDCSGDNMICDSGSHFVTSGFSSSNFTEEVVMFINAGCEASRSEDSGVQFLGDDHYEGGGVLRTDECINEAGDYPFIYQSARLGNFNYHLSNLPPGDYFVDLHFAEIINTFGPKGMRVFNVFIQDEMVLSDFDIFAVVGANKPLQLVGCLVPVNEDGVIVMKFEGVIGSPVVSGICIRRAPKSSEPPLAEEYLRCHNCAAEIPVSQRLEKSLRFKSTAKFQKKIKELSMQCQSKTDECYQAWMSLTAANEQLEKVRMDLDNKLFQTYSLEQTMEKQAKNLRIVSTTYENEKKFWSTAITDLKEKIKRLKQEHSQLSREAHECADSIPDLNKMVFAVQDLVAQCEDFKMKYVEEQKKRKKLYNEVQEAKGNIRVFCRCRPLSKQELSSRCSTVVDFNGAKDGDIAILTEGSNKKTFKFDRVYTPEDGQVDVFADASPVVVSVLDGYNVCIFAYGQTGTGKTFTMEGTEQNRGVNYRTLEKLFEIAKERSDVTKYNISVSVLEVYNEQIRDLLATTSNKLEVKQSSDGFHNVPGMVEANVENIKEVWDVLQAGSKARAVGSNNVNEHSSRSHCVLCVMVKSKNLINGECTKSKLWLVDLAGSERLDKTDAQGERLKEAKNINRSLSALGDVISALASKNSHIPYRNSKLTHLLQDSLGGDSKTLMFVQISPSDQDASETLSSLNFASRARKIELGPVKKQVDTGELQKTKMLLDKAKQESRSKDESIRKLEETMHNLENKAKGKDETYKKQQEKIRELEDLLNSKAKQETRFKDESIKKLEETIHNLENKAKGKDETYKKQQEKIRELEDLLNSKAKQESRFKDESIKKLEETIHNLENKTKGKDESYKKQQEKIRELEDLHNSIAALYSKSEKQLLQLQELLKGKEDACSSLQHKVEELEHQLAKEAQDDSASLQQVRDLEKKFEEQAREFDSNSVSLQEKNRELERKLKEQEHKNDSAMLHEKIKLLEEKVKEQEQKLSERNVQAEAAPVPAAVNTPIVTKPPSSDEHQIEAEPRILRSSNVLNRLSCGSTLSKTSEVSQGTIRRKRGFRSGETENNIPVSSSLREKKIRKSNDPPKPLSRATKAVKQPVAPRSQRVVNGRVNRDVVLIGRDTQKRWC